MIIKFNDNILQVPQKYFREVSNPDPNTSVPGALLVSYQDGVPCSTLVEDVDENGYAQVSYVSIPPESIHEGEIDYTDITSGCSFDFLDEEDWATFIRELIPEYADIPVEPGEPIDIPGGYFEFEGEEVHLYELATRYIDLPIDENNKDPETCSPEEFYNTRLRDRWVQVAYLPALGKYFVLPYTSYEQNYKDDITIDMNAFPLYDMAQDKGEYERKLEEEYPGVYFVSPEVWEKFTGNIDREESNRRAHFVWSRFSRKNSQANTTDITLEQLKVFRTWLAQVLLENPYMELRDDCNQITTMLEYYANNMYSPVIKAFADMKDYITEPPLVIGQNVKSQLQISAGCGCSGGMPSVGVVGNTIACDPIQMYRNAMYNYMVKTFSDIDYWKMQGELCQEVKAYIDGILKAGLPLSTAIVDPYADCSCSSVDGSEERRYRTILQNLSQALQYIVDDKIQNNKNFIYTAFNSWATYLYESMYWM